MTASKKTSEASSLDDAIARLLVALAEVERAVLRQSLDSPDPALADFAAACKRSRAAFSAQSPDTAAALERASRFLSGLEQGRRVAHKNRRTEREARDAQTRSRWIQFRAAGWADDEILAALANRDGVQCDTVRRRARRLGLLLADG